MKKLFCILTLIIFVIACKSTPKESSPEDVIISDDAVAVNDNTSKKSNDKDKTKNNAKLDDKAKNDTNSNDKDDKENTKNDSKSDDKNNAKSDDKNNAKSDDKDKVIDDSKSESLEDESKEVMAQAKLILPNDTSIRLTDRGKVLETNPKIIFKFTETELSQRHSVAFAQVIEFMEKNPHVIIIIEAHTSNKGKAYPYNYQLSKVRAREGKNYLVERGIEKSRLIEKPLGEALPESPNQDNLRRYEFVIIENDDDMNIYNDYVSKLNVKKETTFQGK